MPLVTRSFTWMAIGAGLGLLIGFRIDAPCAAMIAGALIGAALRLA